MRDKLRKDVKNLAGETFGRLRVVGAVRRGNYVKQECICQCGNKCYPRAYDLMKGSVVSCGCWKRDGAHAMVGKENPSYKHGHVIGGTKSVTYTSWTSMITRCTNPRSSSYVNYGMRGIGIHPEWLDFCSFLKDVGPAPTDDSYWSVGRIDNDVGYIPGNVRWEGRSEQARNRRSCIWLEHNDQKMLVTDWEVAMGYKKDLIGKRLRRGWSPADAISKPPRRVLKTVDKMAGV